MRRIFIAVITAGVLFASCTKQGADSTESASISSDAKGIKVQKGDPVPDPCPCQFLNGTKTINGRDIGIIPPPNICIDISVACACDENGNRWIDGNIVVRDCETDEEIASGIFYIRYKGPNNSMGQLQNPANWQIIGMPGGDELAKQLLNIVKLPELLPCLLYFAQ